MKTKLFTLLLAVAASVGTMFAESGTCGGNLTWDLTNGVLTISGTGAMFNYKYAPWYDYRENISQVVINDGVTSIGERAFDQCTGLTSVTIPGSVTNIGDYAFNICTGLTSVTIPNSVTSIGSSAFIFCTGLTSIEIPNSVTSIGNSAFYYCSGLTAITIGNSVTSIGNSAFSRCSSLTSVTIPNSVTSIGREAFSSCSSLTSVTIPNSVTSIGNSAFSGCSGLTAIDVAADNPNYCSEDGVLFDKDKLTLIKYPTAKQGSNYTIPNSVTSIGNSAFYGCSGLTSVTIPYSVTSIGDRAFSNCTGLTSVTIPNSVTSIAWSAFESCTSLTSVTIPNSVTSIEGSAFKSCTSLTSVTIPNSVTSIEGSAFESCTSLTSVTIPNSVTSIGYRAFYGCSGLTSVTIPNSVTSIEGSAFESCTSLTSIYVPCGELERFRQMLSYDGRVKYEPLPYNLTINAENGSVTTTDVATLTICDEPFITCTATPDYGYHFTQWSDGLKDNPRTIVLTQDTTFTAEFAYDRVGACGKDLALVWSYDPANKVLTIGNAGSFTENMQFGVEAPNEMEELVIGNSVTAIGANAFAGIETLKKVSIGESVKTIGEQAFYNCMNLETIFNYRPTPTNTYSNAFDGVDKFECVLYVLPSSIDMYKNASVWRDFYYTYAIGAEEATVTTNDVQVEPQDNAATLTWPTSNNAASYTIQITKDGVLFCTLVFNANGQLTGIAFAPSRDGQAHAPAAVMTANGLQFTVTGLNSGTQYGYNLTAKDANDQTVATYSGEFTTTSEDTATGIEDVQGNNVQCKKVVRDGQIFILRGDKTYTTDGRLVR